MLAVVGIGSFEVLKLGNLTAAAGAADPAHAEERVTSPRSPSRLKHELEQRTRPEYAYQAEF